MRTSIGLILLSLQLAACGGYVFPREAEHTTPLGDGRFWVSGNRGFAAIFDGQTYVPTEYPRDRSAPDWAYEGGGNGFDWPTTFVLRTADHDPILIGRGGDVLRFHNGRWTRHAVRFPSQYGERPQINVVIPTPDGRFLIQVHSETLLWTTPEQLLRSEFEYEETQTFLTWFGFVGPTLYGLGWDEGGNRRALLERIGREEWRVVALLDETELSTLHGVVRWPSGELAVVGGQALGLVDPQTGATRTFRPCSVRPDECQNSTASYAIELARSSDGTRSAIVLSGATSAVLLIDADGVTFSPCSALGYDAADGFPYGAGFRFVLADASVVDVDAQTCRIVHAGLLRSD